MKLQPIFKDIVFLFTIQLILTTLLWLPHIFNLPNFYGLNFSKGFSTIYENYDGLNYIVIAKSFYNPDIISSLPQPLPASYFPAHFPGYPLLIALFAPLFGYLKSMLLVTQLFTFFSVIAFYLFLVKLKLTQHPLWLSALFLIIPGRWLIVHSVGSPEPLFIFFTITSIYLFIKFIYQQNNRYLWYSAILASFAQLIRPPGILLFFAYAIYLLIWHFKQKQYKDIFLSPFKYFPLILIPLTLLAIFFLFSVAQGNFLAYFQSGDNIHLTFPPYQIFNSLQPWVGDIWLEDIVYIFAIVALGGLLLLKTQIAPAGYFVLVYLAATIFVAHRDISRYILPVFPFILIAFEKTLTSREFKIVSVIVILAIYLYAQNFIINNFAPVAILSAFN